jgi:maltose operon protein
MPANRLSPATLALCAVLLTGCAVTGGGTSAGVPASDTARLAAYQRATPCCTDPAGFAFEPLPAVGTVTRLIGASTPLYEFQSGRSHFAAFRLPEGDEPYRVRVKSFFAGPVGPGGYIFYPVVALLDDSLFVSRVTDLDHLRLDQGLAVPGGQAGLAVTVPLDRRLAKERYLVVFTPAVLLGAPPEERREGDLLTDSAQEWMARRSAALVEPSPYGRIEVTVIPGSGPAEAPEPDGGS